MYTVLVLERVERELLLIHLDIWGLIPKGWEVIAHHMTINMGALCDGPAYGKLGVKAGAKVIAYGYTDGVMAVKVESIVPSKNETKHITIAVNRELGGRPWHSNKITEWKEVPYSFMVWGMIEEVE